MNRDIKPFRMASGGEIKRKSLPIPELKEKQSIAFHASDYDPTQAPAHLSPHPKELDTYESTTIVPNIHSTPSFTTDKIVSPTKSDSLASDFPFHSTPSFPIDKLVIPTKTDSLASGFPFHQRLYDYRITHDEWHLFTGEIVKAATLTLQEDWAAWTAGISTGVLITGFLVFGGPFVGYYTGRSVHRKKVISKVKDSLMHEGNLRSTLYRWNEQTFHEKGFHAWLELPVVKGEVNGEESDGDKKKSSRKERKAKAKERRRFRIIIIPNDAHMSMMLMRDRSTWSLADTRSIQRSEISNGSGIAEAPDTQQPRIAELE